MKKTFKLLSIIIVLLFCLILASCGNDETNTDGRIKGKYKGLSEAELNEITTQPENNFTALVTTTYPLGDVVVQKVKVDGEFSKEDITSLKCSYEENDELTYLIYRGGDQLFEIRNVDDEWIGQSVDLDKSLFMLFVNLKDFFSTDFLMKHFNEQTGKYYIKGYYIDGLKSDIEFTMENGHVTHVDWDSGRFNKSIDISDFNNTTVNLPTFRIETSIPFINKTEFSRLLDNAVNYTLFNNLTLHSITKDYDVIHKYQVNGSYGNYFSMTNGVSKQWFRVNNDFYEYDFESLSFNKLPESDKSPIYNARELAQELFTLIDREQFQVLDYNSKLNNLHILSNGFKTNMYGDCKYFEVVIKNGLITYIDFETTVMNIKFSYFGKTKIELVSTSSNQEELTQEDLIYLLNSLVFDTIKNYTVSTTNNVYKYDLENMIMLENEKNLVIKNYMAYEVVVENNMMQLKGYRLQDTSLILDIMPYLLDLYNIPFDEFTIDVWDNVNGNYHILSNDFELSVENNQIKKIKNNNIEIYDINNTVVPVFDYPKTNDVEENADIDNFISVLLSPGLFKNFTFSRRQDNISGVYYFDLENRNALSHENNVELSIDDKVIDCAYLDSFYTCENENYRIYYLIDGYRSETKITDYDTYSRNFENLFESLELILRNALYNITNQREYNLESGNVDIDFSFNILYYNISTDVEGTLSVKDFKVNQINYKTMYNNNTMYATIDKVNETVVTNPTKQ